MRYATDLAQTNKIDSDFILAGLENGTISVWNLKEGRIVRRLGAKSEREDNNVSAVQEALNEAEKGDTLVLVFFPCVRVCSDLGCFPSRSYMISHDIGSSQNLGKSNKKRKRDKKEKETEASTEMNGVTSTSDGASTASKSVHIAAIVAMQSRGPDLWAASADRSLSRWNLKSGTVTVYVLQ